MEAKNALKSGSNTFRTLLYHKDLSRYARQRLKWMNHFNKYRNVRLTCRHFGISPDTFYLWKKRFLSGQMVALEDNYGSRKPHNIRTSKHKARQLQTIKRLKNTDPRLGKIKIAKILKKTGYEISSSTVGRILRNIKDQSQFNRG